MISNKQWDCCKEFSTADTDCICVVTSSMTMVHFSTTATFFIKGQLLKTSKLFDDGLIFLAACLYMITFCIHLLKVKVI